MVPVAYNLRSLAVRKTTTAATAGGIALVVFVFSSVMMLAQGIEQTLGRSGSPDVAVVLRDGSDAEMSSGIDIPQVALVLAAPGVRTRPDGRQDGVGEVVGVLALDKLGADGVSNVLVRGIGEDAFDFRSSVKIVAGRRARPGADEAIIGASLRGRFRGLDPGQMFEIRKNRPVHVVGVFADRGSSFESEVWADVDTVRTAFGREGLVSAIRVRLRSPEAFDAFRQSIKSNRQLGLDVQRETKYYASQSQNTGLLIRGLGLSIAIFFSIGAMIGAMITMYAAVANRSREIGTLRALGFSKASILLSFLLESIVLAVGGGVLGALASLAMGFVEFSIVNFVSWSELVFRFVPTPGIIAASLIFAACMGLIGGLFPAVRAARMALLDAIRA